VGTRVTYYETIDQKTGKPRADQVQLEAAQWVSWSANSGGWISWIELDVEGAEKVLEYHYVDIY